MMVANDLLRRKAGMSRGDFIKYYEGIMRRRLP
jgi:hypothetical protein